MKKVSQFKSVLSIIDIISTIVIVLVIIASIIQTAQTSIWIGGMGVIYAVSLWVIKVLTFGIAYSVIQIAENTKTNQELTPEVRNSEFLEVIHKNKAAEFVTLYLEDESNSNDPYLKRIFENISNDVLFESTSNLEHAIRKMSDKP